MSIRKVSIVGVLVGMITVAGGCTGEGARTHEYVVRDSAGIRVIEYGDIIGVPSRVRVAEEPVYRHGWEAGQRLWGVVSAGTLLSDGRAAVADRATSEVVVLGADGAVESVVGGPGQGPGELGSIFALVAAGEDTIVVQDAAGGGITLFHSGQPVRTLATQTLLPTREASSLDGEGGLLLGGMPNMYSPNFSEPWLRLPLYRLDMETGSADTIALAAFVQNREASAGNPFAAVGHSTAWEGGFVVGRGNAAELTWLDLRGQITQVVRWMALERPLTDEVWRSFEDHYRDRWPGAPEALDAMILEMRAAARGPLPEFAGLIADSDGNVWIADHNPADYRFSPRHQLVSPSGEWLGTVTLPDRFQVLDISSQYILGVQRDPLDVEAVALYRLERH